MPAPLNSVFPWPGAFNISGSVALTTAATLSASGHYIAWGFVAKEAMTISHVGFRCGVVAGSPTVEVRIETVAADGTPSGTLFGTNTNATSGTLTSSTNTLLALTAAASIAAGQAFIVMVKYASGTSAIIQRLGNWLAQRGTPWQITNTSGSAVKSVAAQGVIFTLGSSSTVFYQLPSLVPGVSSVANNSFNNTSSAKRGLRFKVPVRCRCVGLRTYDALAVGDYSIAMYSDAGSELSNSDTAFDGNFDPETYGERWLYFDNPVTLEADTWYRGVMIPSSATNCNITTLALVSSTYVQGHAGGANQHYTTYAGSWDDSATGTLPVLDILIDQM